MVRIKKYSPGSLDTREKLVKALCEIPGVGIKERPGNRHHITVVYRDNCVPIQESGRVRNPGHYARRIFKELGLQNYLM